MSPAGKVLTTLVPRPSGFGSVGVARPDFWALGFAFLLVYLSLEWVTIIYQIDGLGITLWSPAAGLSLALLLICGPGFAPFVFVAALIADYLIYSGPRGAVAPVGTSFVLALGLCAMAEAL